MQKLFNKCPACGGELVITECQCAKCRLQMRGEFQPGPLAALSDDELTFIRVFLAARGNLTEVERVLGISYPTIRNKLDDINSAIGRAGDVSESSRAKNAAPPAGEDPRRDILQSVEDGKLSPEEAVEKLRKTRGPREANN